MRILIDQHRDCFNFATRRKDQKLPTSEGRRGQKKGANGEKSRERNVTQVARDGDGGKMWEWNLKIHGDWFYIQLPRSDLLEENIPI